MKRGQHSFSPEEVELWDRILQATKKGLTATLMPQIQSLPEFASLCRKVQMMKKQVASV